eukprot:CAMPEP_0182507426 /NCGR_PEP_ID=MMETSP1321-20130603/23126_1 /TAXON_ID=91990 /ORGANISM="Bolidomonas sp., Strain RCC1657" /LENGTH=36 /DNA_ID= /DNA_START= /DNA_END= /DNA_ORIENTATION=
MSDLEEEERLGVKDVTTISRRRGDMESLAWALELYW